MRHAPPLLGQHNDEILGVPRIQGRRDRQAPVGQRHSLDEDEGMSLDAPGTSLYFAYGSNMCTGNLRQVAPSATRDRRGAAAEARAPVPEAQRPRRWRRVQSATRRGGRRVSLWGVLFRMADADLQALIRLEDDRYGYVPTPKAVFPRDSGEPVTALVFMAELTRSRGLPSPVRLVPPEGAGGGVAARPAARVHRQVDHGPAVGARSG